MTVCFLCQRESASILNSNGINQTWRVQQRTVRPQKYKVTRCALIVPWVIFFKEMCAIKMNGGDELKLGRRSSLASSSLLNMRGESRSSADCLRKTLIVSHLAFPLPVAACLHFLWLCLSNAPPHVSIMQTALCNFVFNCSFKTCNLQ